MLSVLSCNTISAQQGLIFYNFIDIFINRIEKANKISTPIAVKFCPTHIGIRNNGSIILWPIATTYAITISFATCR
jgi:hypothetical protein